LRVINSGTASPTDTHRYRYQDVAGQRTDATPGDADSTTHAQCRVCTGYPVHSSAAAADPSAI